MHSRVLVAALLCSLGSGGRELQADLLLTNFKRVMRFHAGHGFDVTAQISTICDEEWPQVFWLWVAAKCRVLDRRPFAPAAPVVSSENGGTDSSAAVVAAWRSRGISGRKNRAWHPLDPRRVWCRKRSTWAFIAPERASHDYVCGGLGFDVPFSPG